MTLTIAISDEIKKQLEKLRIHPRETWNDIIKRLIKLKEEAK